MDIPFAFLLIVSCALGVWAVTATQRNNSLKKKNDELEDKSPSSKQIVGVDTSYSEALTPELVCQAVKTNGYVPVMHQDCVVFKVQGETYAIFTDRLPILTLYKGYNIDKSDYDIRLLKEACIRTTYDIIMAKASVDDDETGMCFRIAVSEHCYGNFCASLERYISVLDDAAKRSQLFYDELLKEQEILNKNS